MSTENRSINDRLSALAALAPQLDISTDPGPRSEKARDMWVRSLMESRLGRAPQAAAVLRPSSTAETAEALKWAQETKTALVPYGLGSGVCGAVLAAADHVVLDMAAMDKVLEIDETSLTATVQPGLRGSQFEARLAEKGFTMGHWPQSIELSSVGGWAATRASGQFSTLYGNIEQMLLGCEVVLAGGRVVRIPAMPRSATGPDLRQVFMGSEGTLGVFTELTYRIHRAAEHQACQSFSFGSLADATQALREMVQCGWTPAVTRLYDAVESARNFAGVTEPDRALLLLLGEGNRRRVETEAEGLAEIAAAHGGVLHGPDPVTGWLDHRNTVPTFESLLDQGILADTIEVAIDWGSLEGLWDRVCAEVSAIEGVLAMSGHVSHCYTQGANIYFTFIAAESDLDAAIRLYDQVWSKTMSITTELGGTIAHHHGIGRVRRGWLPTELGEGMAVLRSLKTALDPQGILNPGALIEAD